MTFRGPLLGVAATLAALCTFAPAASAATPITTYLNACPTYPGDVRTCSGQVPSFDGSPLDVDVTLPSNGGGAKHPLIVMLHGFGNSKHEWESTTAEGDDGDKYHWNTKWFADHGYYVVNYTARGFRDDGTNGAYQPETPSFSSFAPPSGTIRVKSREVEIRDTQYLAALVADAFPDLDPNHVAVTGGSYGGGESWVQASQSTWTFPGLPVLHLQVAVPKYPWTDLAYGLAPNGHPGVPGKPGRPAANDLYESSQGAPDSPTGDGNPIGVAKESYITGLFATGTARGAFDNDSPTPPTDEGPVDINSWNGRLVGTGDPYDVAGLTPTEDPIVRQARRGLTEYRSAYYQDEGWAAQREARKVAVFSIQGWTDDLFEAVESFRMFKYLKRLDPRWPVSVAVADIGHSRAQNAPAQWHHLNHQAWQWMQSNINGSHEQSTTVSSQPTLCPNDGDPARNDSAIQELTATSPEGLANGTLAVAITGGKALTNASGTGDPDNVTTDPILSGIGAPVTGGEPCRASAASTFDTRFTAVSEPLTSTRTYVGLGSVDLLDYTYAGTAGTLAARVWDVAPGGKALLITRGIYRLDAPTYDEPAGTIRLPLYGNHWTLKPGHKIRLDLQEDGSPTFRFNNSANAFRFANPRLVLPTRQAADTTLTGTGG
jgi:predicted acyl esterase